LKVSLGTIRAYRFVASKTSEEAERKPSLLSSSHISVRETPPVWKRGRFSRWKLLVVARSALAHCPLRCGKSIICRLFRMASGCALGTALNNAMACSKSANAPGMSRDSMRKKHRILKQRMSLQPASMAWVMMSAPFSNCWVSK